SFLCPKKKPWSTGQIAGCDLLQTLIIPRQFDVRKRQWICFLISGKRPKNVGIMLEKVANYLYLSS
ncbi:hypothetical protein, partial [Prevotella intermedia]|uniref:hypothetical protein n=1 Tax=Prevotella intermedia TaxID=28131 RepID=UPI0015E09837